LAPNLRHTCVGQCPRQAPVSFYPGKAQVLHNNRAVLLGEGGRQLMQAIGALISNPSMNPTNPSLSGFATVGTQRTTG